MRIPIIAKLLAFATVAVYGSVAPRSDSDAKTEQVAFPMFQGGVVPASICSGKNELPWSDKYHRGGTGYIDGITPSDLKQPVMCGTDSVGRRFIAFKFACTSVVDGVKKVAQGAMTLFQRYIGKESITKASHAMTPDCRWLPDELEPSYGKDDLGSQYEKFFSGAPFNVLSIRGDRVTGTMEICNPTLCPEELPALPRGDQSWFFFGGNGEFRGEDIV